MERTTSSADADAAVAASVAAADTSHVSVIPNKQSKSRMRIACVLHEHGPMTRVEIRESLPDGWQHLHNFLRSLEGMVRDGQLLVEGDVLSLPGETSAYLTELAAAEAQRKNAGVPLVPPRSVPPFRPLSAKYIPSAYGTRSDAGQREIHFFTLSSNVVYHWEDE
jgi:hypothetical protein